MEKTVTILSAGMGGRESMSGEAVRLAEQADLLIGATRLVEAWPEKRTSAEYRPDRIRRIVDETEADSIAVLVSGDAGFFSGSAAVSKALETYRPRVVAGISSLAAFSARTGIPYGQANIVSAHGRTINIVSEVRRHRITFVLGGGNLNSLIARLLDFRMADVEICIGENLGYPQERILHGSPEALKDQPVGPLSVMAVVNEAFSAPAAASVPDEAFARGRVPMTKDLVRGSVIRKLRLREDSVVFDIGAGTGSVSVEAALNAWRGTVYAFDHNEEAVALIRENALRMQTDNVVAVHGDAPEILRGYPVPDAVFIGGSDGRLEEILYELMEMKMLRQEARVRVVITAVTLQTLEKAAGILRKMDLSEDSGTEMVQISANRLVRMGAYDMFRPETPVFLISVTI